MQMAPYITFNGNCEAAFAFYQQHLGGVPGGIFRYEGTPIEHQVPVAWGNKIMHASMTVGGQLLMAADAAPGLYEEPKGFSLSLQVSDVADAERIFAALATGGRVLMPLEKTFWAARFGMLVDQFGIQWMINCEGANESK
jgi:PhnB protein